ncbi:hypothetical protein [Aquabacterium sp.]|nr:hypothetical protein [Aquabacterium sp.]MDI1260788.1 hypothetical protein [Aquabacterium sp.]
MNMPLMPSRRPWRWLAYLGAVALLMLVFLMYFRSHLVFDLASRLWSCF